MSLTFRRFARRHDAEWNPKQDTQLEEDKKHQDIALISDPTDTVTTLLTGSAEQRPQDSQVVLRHSPNGE